MAGQQRTELEGTFTTRTDADGRWWVRPALHLHFGILAPDAMPGFGDEMVFTTAAGERLTVAPEAHRRSEAPSPLRNEPALTPRPWFARALPTFGLTIGGGQRFSAHVGGVLLLWRLVLGIRGDVRAGTSGAGAGVALVLFPFVELGATWLRPWDERQATQLGPELALDLFNLRLSFAVLAPTEGPGWDSRSLVVGVGWGFL